MKIKHVSTVIFLTALLQAPAGFSASSLVDSGHQVYKRWCTPCHDNGSHMPGTEALQAKYKGKLPAVLEQRKDLTPELVKLFVRQGINVMPPFRKTEISDADLKALGAYLSRNRSK